jgi:hypothetical protein
MTSCQRHSMLFALSFWFSHQNTWDYFLLISQEKKYNNNKYISYHIVDNVVSSYVIRDAIRMGAFFSTQQLLFN